MMETAFLEIDKSDFLIAELTTKSIGVGIGYAYAKEKPVIYLRKKDSEYSSTAYGCSSEIVICKNEFDLKETMEKLLNPELND